MKKLTLILIVFIVSAVSFTHSFIAEGRPKVTFAHGKAESWMGPDGIPVVTCTGGMPDICWIKVEELNRSEVHVSGSKIIVEDIIQVSRSTENNIISETFKLIQK